MFVCGVVLNFVLKSLVGCMCLVSVNWLVSELGFSFLSGYVMVMVVFYGFVVMFLIFIVLKMW